MTTMFHPPAAQAFWLGDAAAPMLAHYHPAQHNSKLSRRCGVVLCAPFGHEYMVSYMSLRMLAARLSAAGFDVLSFDYQHTGDAADISTAQIAAWQDNIRTAAAWLREQAQVQHLCLAGLRFGALLAASVSADCRADALLLCAPVISGRAYARELQVLRNMGLPPEVLETLSDEELTGYVFPAETRSAMAALDLKKMAVPACPVLLLSRDDIEGQEAALAAQWQQQHDAVSFSALPGYQAMMQVDAHSSVVPHAMWQHCTDWLSSQFPEIHAAATAPKLPASANEAQWLQDAMTIREKIVHFDGMEGVLSLPQQPDTQKPAVILCNIGANHRTGNHRLYVKLARALIQQGFTVLRFDKSGIGYSRATAAGNHNDVHAADGIADIRAAMDFLEQQGYQEFVLGGLCSGAYFAYSTSLADKRICGLMLMNQLVYVWNPEETIEQRRQTSIKSSSFYVKALRDPATWKRLFSGDIRFGLIFSKLSARILKRLAAIAHKLTENWLPIPFLLSPEARHLRAFCAQGKHVLMVMDAGDASVDLMTEKFGRHAALLRRSNRFDMWILRGADHTFTPLHAQQKVISYLTKQLQQRFGDSAA